MASVTNLVHGDLGHPISVAWQACTNQGIPGDFSSATPPYIACLALNNLTGSPISSLTFQFVVPSLLNGQTVDCSNDGHYLGSPANCPTGKLATGELVTFGFSGLPPIPNNTDFFLGASADGLTDPNDFPGVNMTAALPEPAALGMFGLGLALIAVLVELRRRRCA